jgi:hypothetical protein
VGERIVWFIIWRGIFYHFPLLSGERELIGFSRSLLSKIISSPSTGEAKVRVIKIDSVSIQVFKYLVYHTLYIV